MRIRFVTPWYGEFAGGAEFAARKLAENLRERGVDAGVMTTCCRSPFDDWWTDHFRPGECEVNGVPVERFPVNREGAQTYRATIERLVKGRPFSRQDELDFMRSCIGSHALISRLRKDKDSVHAFIPYLYGTTFWGLHAASEKPVVIPCLHDEAEARWGIVKEAFSKASKFIFLSEEERALASGLYGERMSSMPVAGMGVDTDIECSAWRFRERFRFESPFLVYAGRKVQGKNIQLLIEYFKRYTEYFDGRMRLVFIGGGDPSMLPKDDGRFVDLGFVSEQEKLDAIAASTALCNLSLNESFSFVVMESWLAGRPVVVSDSGRVTKEHCMKSGGGFAVSDAYDFCEKVHMLAQGELLAKEMGAAGRKYVIDNYSWDKVITRYMEVFSSLQ